MGIRFLPALNAEQLPFTPADTLTSTTVQAAIVEALSDARAYSDAVAAGLDPKGGVDAATFAPLPANTRTSNTLTADADGALTNIDTSFAPSVGSRILVKDEVLSQNDGIYVVDSIGSPSSRWSMTRSASADTSAEVTSGMYTCATHGAHAGQGWFLQTPDPIVLNTTPLSFQPFSVFTLDSAYAINTPAGGISAVTTQAAINELDTEKAALAGATFTGPARGSATVLTSASNSIAINLGATNDFTHTTTENTTLAAPTNVVIGQRGRIVFTQGGTPMTTAFNVFWKFANGIIPSLTSAAGAIDVMTYDVLSSGTALCAMFGDVK